MDTNTRYKKYIGILILNFNSTKYKITFRLTIIILINSLKHKNNKQESQIKTIFKIHCVKVNNKTLIHDEKILTCLKFCSNNLLLCV